MHLLLNSTDQRRNQQDTLPISIFCLICINNKFVPKGLELSLEPTIGNYDQSFIDNWYSKLKDFSLRSSFCDKTIKETKTKIVQTEGIVKQQLGKNEYEEKQKTNQMKLQ